MYKIYLQLNKLENTIAVTIEFIQTPTNNLAKNSL